MIDLRSDTVTKPTWEMRVDMYEAVVGDDVYEDDPTVKALERKSAKLVGKEAALFVPTGTFGNQLALFTHCNRGDEVILGDDCHIVQHEAGSAAIIAGVQLRTINTDKGRMDAAEIERRIRKTRDIHFPETSLICLENAHSNGRVLSLDHMAQVHALAQANHVPIHLDGARLFNAAAHLGVEATQLTRYCDSVMFCLSKGLCAPVGSILAGSTQFIAEARRKRKIMGGGMRQAGVIAAAGMVAIHRMIEKLPGDHALAQKLGKGLSDIEGVHVNMDDIHINMVFFTLPERYDPEAFIAYLLKNEVKVNGPENGCWRFVTHHDVHEEDIDKVLELIRSYKG